MRKILTCILTSVTLFPFLSAETQSDTGKQFPPQSTAIKGVLVPIPKEIFDTLDKFGHSNWHAVQRPEISQWRSHGEQNETALLLGVVIAEGFIAVEAEDADEVRKIGGAVLRLARGLGVERVALQRSRSIVEHADRNDWPGVRQEWDGVLTDVQQGMNDLKSEELAQLVSLGGWLRGTEALSALVLQNYSTQKADLLRQPALLDYFEKRLAAMSDKVTSNRVIAKIREGMVKTKPRIASTRASISQQEVEEISSISHELIKNLGR